jgi:hypothetical protein
MQTLRLRIRILPRRPADPAAYVGDSGEGADAQEGRGLVGLVRDVLERGGGGAVAVVVRPDRTELVDLRNLIEARASLPLFMAGLTRSAPEGQRLPLAVGIAGRFMMRTGPPQVPVSPQERRPRGIPVGVVFLEWPDCRWWHWRVVLGADGQPMEDGETVWRAEDGDPLPQGLGRWWSLGRRTGNVVHYGAPDSEDAESDAASLLVH